MLSSYLGLPSKPYAIFSTTIPALISATSGATLSYTCRSASELLSLARLGESVSCNVRVSDNTRPSRFVIRYNTASNLGHSFSSFRTDLRVPDNPCDTTRHKIGAAFASGV